MSNEIKLSFVLNNTDLKLEAGAEQVSDNYPHQKQLVHQDNQEE